MQTATTKNGPLDEGALARLRELDPQGANGLLPRVIRAYFDSLAKLLPELEAARGPVPDFDKLRQVAHTLKSSSASLGALELSQRCAQVELLARERRGEGLDGEIEAMLAGIEAARTALAGLLATA
jgi:HPt (histidine-containing phosphotransfer) domain-containing protein